jgi:hypothetical protein
MNTTLLFAELLITGLQVGFWFFFLILSIFGYGWLQGPLSVSLADWQAVIIATLFSFFYALGIIVDRLADRLFATWEWRITKRAIPQPPKPIAVMRFELAKDNEALNQQFDYNRSRMRIARASALNFGLTTVFAAIFILTRLPTLTATDRWIYVVLTAMTGLLITLSAVYAWQKLMRGYVGLVRDSYAAYQLQQKPATPTSEHRMQGKVEEETP